MRALVVVAMVVIGILLPVEAFHANSFDAINGCKQYGKVGDYNDPLVYIPTSNLLHVGYTHRSKFFKVAVLGGGDVHIRYGSSPYPYNKNVIEIVIGGWGNQKNVARRQHRLSSNRYTNIELGASQTPNVLDPSRPNMFIVELFHDGIVQVRIDGQDQPFLSFHDSMNIPSNYIAFSTWSRHLIYFYDCPLDRNAKICYEGGKIQ